jgi:hypothetical protein
MIITPIGSNTGLSNAVHGMWLILPLIFLSALEIRGRIKCPWIHQIFYQLEKILLLLLIISLALNIFCIYRDHYNRLRLVSAFTHPSLEGIFSTPQRVKAVEEVVEIIESHTEPGDHVLIANSVPMLYYLTQTRPILGEPWLFLETLSDIKEKHQKLEEDQRLPKLFCCNKINSRDPEWPDPGQTDPLSQNDEEKVEYLLSLYTSDPRYMTVLDNQIFTVMIDIDQVSG